MTRKQRMKKEKMGTQISGQMELFEFLEGQYSRMPDRRVTIEGAVNAHSFPMSDYVVQSTYRDIFLIVNMLDDYVSMLTEPGRKNNFYVNHMAGEFARISKELAEQIHLDKEKMYKRCRKKKSDSDAGEDSMILTSRGMKKPEKETEKRP